ncbi:MAG: helix-turn-helix transcriptional regulator [Salinarimonas sp.]|nr:helix-turn-helix transcriptional regulator [Salinarimonas sp.]
MIIPRAMVLSEVADADRLMRDKLPVSPELKLLLSYAQMLARLDQPLDERVARACADHIRDLLALALGPTRDAAEQAAGRGLRHARLAAVKADIKHNLTRKWLTLETLARRHGISPQYLRSLFYKDGTSVSEYIRNSRLEHARHLLCDPEHRETRISDIAFTAGFGDLSHFNKAFRSRFGMTPSDARADAPGAQSAV